MLEVTISGIRCKLSLYFPAVLLCMLYFDPSGMVLFGFLAAFIHESGHLLMAFILGSMPKELVISCFGMRLVADPYLRRGASTDIGIALAGPITNLLMAFVLACFPLSSIYTHIHLVMAVFNLLPVYPLDGGRALVAFFEERFDMAFGRCLESVTFILTVIPLFLLGILLVCQPSCNPTLLIVSVYLIFMRLFYNGN